MLNKRESSRDGKRKYIKCRVSDEMYGQLIFVTSKTGLCISDVVRLGLINEIERLKGEFFKDAREESYTEQLKRKAHENALRRTIPN